MFHISYIVSPTLQDGVVELPLVVVSYSLAGQLLAVRELSSQLLLCPPSPRPYLRAGLHYTLQVSRASHTHTHTHSVMPHMYK